MLTGGYVLNGLHPRLLSIRTYGALSGCFIVPWVAPVPWVLPTAVILRTYGALYGAQQRFSVTEDFWGDVSEETDYIFTKYRLVYIINFVALWSKEEQLMYKT